VGDGVFTIALNRNAEVKMLAERNLEADFTNSIMNTAINAVFVCQAIRDDKDNIIDLLMQRVNSAFTQIVKRTEEEVIGNTYLNLFPSSKHQGAFDINCSVINSSVSLRKEMYYSGEGLDAWFDVSLSKLGHDGLLVTFSDITENKRSKQLTEDFATYLQRIINTSQTAFLVLIPVRDEHGEIEDYKFRLSNKAYSKYTNKTPEELEGTLASEVFSAGNRKNIFNKFKDTSINGIQNEININYTANGNNLWLNIVCSKLDEELLVTITDYTDIKNLQIQLEHNAERLNAVFNASQTGMFTFAPVYDDRGELIDFRFVIVNRTLAGYVFQSPEKLEGDLGSTWFPGYLTNGVFDMYKATYLSGETQRKEVHYNVDGINIHLDLMSTKVGDEVLVTFTDHTMLTNLQLSLQQKVTELEQVNKNLEEFAYAASHDLKEPIRKIHFFADRLKSQYGNLLPADGTKTFDRLQHATERMRMLVDDLLEFSHLDLKSGLFETIDLNDKLRLVQGDLELAISEKKAIIHVDKLPKVQGNRRQLQQLFQNLVANALKYSKTDVSPTITINATIVKGNDIGLVIPLDAQGKNYHKIQVADNGIGFEQENAERIFQVFQRLHGKQEYSGSGIGLAIVKKVIDNHNGYIVAEGVPNEGATFSVFLPVQ
ncbi:MAG TPA: ATP-binding protein, partial [Chitinophagaceae bacterium]|nr:ATP-binding protein [Chitinophagaceae bacterium]